MPNFTCLRDYSFTTQIANIRGKAIHKIYAPILCNSKLYRQ